ncbi:biopolymer transporter ExbD [Erythrobacter sp. HL-111]|uniref:biopolymer transporter ExbD n=1 Tax=Erythrobacter sp. HL-111 TaxID=1798193 RepID=UPI0006D9CBCC|nr:biopolymer transporter ExbD [Erythrobacter sp. HL-111]KPP92928.1 MAG: biopolymer transport protein ExbD [Erythrobacteraceae bacterium HL-111]SDT02189.1 outer membrane transport energization protein ExbD [Erythrobacter sp. HL-111]
MIAPRRRRRRSLSITSLIDVIFLLLLFFMLASTFRQFAELEIGGVTAAAPGAVAVEITPMRLVVEPASVTLDGAAMTDGELIGYLAGPTDAPRRVNLHLADGVNAQRLTDVLTLIEPVSGLEVNMVVPQ